MNLPVSRLQRFVRLTSVTTLTLVSYATLAWAANPGVVVDVALTPAGDFKAKTNEISGEAVQEGDTVRAENIVVKLANLKTGIALRDKHTKDKLEVTKFPEAVLVSATGKGGKGSGKLRIKGKEENVEGTYKIEDGHLVADFPVKLSKYGFTGIKYMSVGVDDEIKLHVTVPLKKR